MKLLNKRIFQPESPSTTAIKALEQRNSKSHVPQSQNWLSEWNKLESQYPEHVKKAVDYRSDYNWDIGTNSLMGQIVSKLKKSGYIGGDISDTAVHRPQGEIVEDIFFVQQGIFPNVQGGFSSKYPFGEDRVLNDGGNFKGLKPKRKWMIRSDKTLAEQLLPEAELKRLRICAHHTDIHMTIGNAGLTQDAIDSIEEKWKTHVIIKIKFFGVMALDMRSVHEMLEKKTGGMVICRRHHSVSLAQVLKHDSSRDVAKEVLETKQRPVNSLQGDLIRMTRKNLEFSSRNNIDTKVKFNEKNTELDVPYELGMEQLLKELGPRCTEWPNCCPLPVDADELPGIVPGYKPPFRLLPFGLCPHLSAHELRYLRRFAKNVHPHFALGKSRELEGLAVAMLKVWEKSIIVKVAFKRGVQLTTSKKMAKNIKKLTGCKLLSRSKYAVVFYRGKDFLAPDIAGALLKQERHIKSLLAKEGETVKGISDAQMVARGGDNRKISETCTVGSERHKVCMNKMMGDDVSIKHAQVALKLQDRLERAKQKISLLKQALLREKQISFVVLQKGRREDVTDSEIFRLRNLGLNMKSFVLLNRHVLFDEIINNMHVKWKYHEIVKIILKVRNFEEAKMIASSLEAESGGVLILVDTISKRFVILMYRGKCYHRHSTSKSKNLLAKRRAWKYSVGIRTRETLRSTISALQSEIDRIQFDIKVIGYTKDEVDGEFYDQIDSSYPTDGDADDQQIRVSPILNTYFVALSNV